MPDEDEIAILREKARQARMVARTLGDREAADGLGRLAEEYEARAAALETEATLPPSAAIPSGEPPIAQAAAALKPEVPPEPDKGGDD